MTPSFDKEALLRKFAAGCCSREERAQVLGYLQTPEGIQHMRKVMNETGFDDEARTAPDAGAPLPQRRSDRLFARIEARIQAAEAKPRKLTPEPSGRDQPLSDHRLPPRRAGRPARPRRRGTHVRRVAAAIVVILAVGVLLFRFGANRTAWSDGGSQIKVATVEGEQRVVRLADGTRVRLNEHSTLTYPERFRGRSHRKVRLEGEGYFDVAANSNAPFIISTSNGRVRVVGTAFNVKTGDRLSSDRVQPIDSLVVAVDDGVVALQRAREADGRAETTSMRLHAGEVGVLHDNQLARHSPTNISNYRSWATGQLRFTNAPFPEVARQLEHLYGTRIVLEDRELQHLQLTARMRRDSLDTVLGEITSALGLRYEREDGAVYITQE